jgi:HEAT repeat protein
MQIRRIESDPVVRAQAAAALAKVGGDGALAALGAFMRDPSPSVRRRTAAALGDIGDEAAVRLLGDAAFREPDSDVRRAAVAAIAAYDGDRARSYLWVLARWRNDDAADLAREALRSHRSSR